LRIGLLQHDGNGWRKNDWRVQVDYYCSVNWGELQKSNEDWGLINLLEEDYKLTNRKWHLWGVLSSEK